MTGEALLSLMLDVLPVLAMVGLGVSFLVRRSDYRREEDKLREEILLFRDGKGREGDPRE